jgi:hypothetical protein
MDQQHEIDGTSPTRDQTIRATIDDETHRNASTSHTRDERHACRTVHQHRSSEEQDDHKKSPRIAVVGHHTGRHCAFDSARPPHAVMWLRVCVRLLCWSLRIDDDA